MKKLLILSLMLASSSAFAGEYLVKYRSTSGMNFVNSMSLQKMSALQVLDNNPTASLLKVDIVKSAEAKTLATLLAQSGVEYVVPNAKMHAFTTPVDAAALKDQWAIAKVQAEKAWQRAGNKGSRKVIVALIDTGADYKHEALSQNMVPGFDFKDNDSDPMDETGAQNPGHGTHCSGIIGATGLVDNGTVGISPEVSIMPLRFLGADGSGRFECGDQSDRLRNRKRRERNLCILGCGDFSRSSSSIA